MFSTPKLKFVNLYRSPLGKLFVDVMLDVEMSGSRQKGIAIAGDLFEMRLEGLLNGRQ